MGASGEGRLGGAAALGGFAGAGGGGGGGGGALAGAGRLTFGVVVFGAGTAGCWTAFGFTLGVFGVASTFGFGPFPGFGSPFALGPFPGFGPAFGFGPCFGFGSTVGVSLGFGFGFVGVAEGRGVRGVTTAGFGVVGAGVATDGGDAGGVIDGGGADVAGTLARVAPTGVGLVPVRCDRGESGVAGRVPPAVPGVFGTATTAFPSAAVVAAATSGVTWGALGAVVADCPTPG